MDLDLAAFQRDGYAGPFRAFDRAHAEALFEEAYFPPQLLTWYKSVHEKSVPVADNQLLSRNPVPELARVVCS